MSFRRFLKATSGRSLSSRGDKDEEEEEEVTTEVTVDPDTERPDMIWDKIRVKSSTICKTMDPMDPETPKPKDHIRFVCISDTHSQTHRMSPIPDGDVLLHAGDFSRVGSMKDIVKFNDFLGTLPHKHKIVIAGNHEVTFDRQLMTEQSSHVFMSFASALSDLKEDDWKDIRSKLTHCVYLEDAEVNIMGFRIYGSPWTPEFCDWGFNLPRGQALLDKWDKIPSGIDILMTHGPPLGHGDLTRDDKRAGCVELLRTIQKRVKPKYHVFGHIHEGYGITSDNQTMFVNASVCTVHYKPTNKPIVFDLPTPKIPAMEAETSV